MVKNIRTIVIPQHDDQTYTTEWQYDTWNRLTEMIYPDGETVTYNYNAGGLLQSMSGKKQSDKYDYVTQLGCDKFEQRVLLTYGNGTKTTYSYEPKRRRLSNMTAKTAAGRAMMDNSYGYDAVNNILSLKNNAEVPGSNLMGGSSEYSYEYDDLYRLTSAEGSFTGSNHEHRYNLEMKYNSVGGILEKVQVHERKGSGDSWQQQKKTTYSQSYEYGDNQPHAPIHIGEQKYSYDKNGNQTGWSHDVSGQRRQIVWDSLSRIIGKENRIRAIADNGSVQHYIYDASGTRVLKGKSNGQSIYVNSEYKAGSGNMGNYTVYVNPYLVLRSGGYTKHYYIEGQRIVSKLGSGLDNNGKGQLKAGQDKVNYSSKQQQVREGIVKNLKFLGIDGAVLTAGNSGKTPPGQLKGGKGGSAGGGKDKDAEKFQYFYHPDHLGSSSYITDASGEVYQHLEYFAFGETFVEEHSNTHRTPYLFNGKELDEETGLYYYGARYYDAKTSVWLAVDPLAEKYPAISPYAYVANNPVLYLDPDGRKIVLPKGLSNTQIITIVGNLQSLTNDKVVYRTQKDGSVQIKIASLAKSGSETKVAGTQLLRRLNSSGKTLTIDYQDSQSNFQGYSGNLAQPTNRSNATNGKGSDAIVSFDPASNPGIMTEDPKTGNVSGASRPNYIGLGHELIHAEHYMDGDSNPQSQTDSHTYNNASGNPVTQTYKKEELRTVGLAGTNNNDITENQIRQENGLNKRGAY